MDTFNPKQRKIKSWNEFNRSKDKLQSTSKPVTSGSNIDNDGYKGSQASGKVGSKIMDEVKKKNISNVIKAGAHKEKDVEVLDSPKTKGVKDESTMAKKIKKEILQTKNKK